MHDYTTVLGNTIYLPSKSFIDKDSFLYIVPHELVHIADSRSSGWLAFASSYLFPQFVGVLGLLGFLGFLWSPLFLLFIFFLFLLPFGSKGRTRLEMRGYAMTMQIMKWQGRNLRYPPEWIAQQFTTGKYYWMCRNRKKVREELALWLSRVDTKTLHKYIPITEDMKKLFITEITN
jgi:hypothetical protein